MPFKQVNTLTSLNSSNDGTTLSISCSTSLPATPELAIFCCDPLSKAWPTRRGGEELIHGYKKFFPCAPEYYPPTPPSGTSFMWSLPSSAGACDHCHFVIIQRSAPPLVEWQSNVHDCPPIIIPPPPIDKALFEIAFTSDWTQPGIIAQYDALLAYAVAKAHTLSLHVFSKGSTLCTDVFITEPPGPYNYTIAGFTDAFGNPYRGALHPTIVDPFCSAFAEPHSNNGLWWIDIAFP